MANLRWLIDPVVSNPWLYDQIQRRFGLDETRRRLKPLLAPAAGRCVLDVGAGTGNYTSLLPPETTYVWVDCDSRKLRRFSDKHPGRPALLSDATRLGLRSKSVDYTLCVALSHHISEPGLPLLLAEIARVTRSTFVFVDAVERKHSLTAALLWKLDRGSYPRPAETLLAAISDCFDIHRIERYGSQHHYILCVAHPRYAS